MDAYRLIDRFHSPWPFLTFRAQVHFFRSRLAGAAALFRVGGYYELFGSDAEQLAPLCRLQLLAVKRGRAGCAGFPARRLPVFLAKILAAGRDVAVIDQGERGPCLHDRFVREMLTPGPLAGLAGRFIRANAAILATASLSGSLEISEVKNLVVAETRPEKRIPL